MDTAVATPVRKKVQNSESSSTTTVDAEVDFLQGKKACLINDPECESCQ
jgi:hypothetical protein